MQIKKVFFICLMLSLWITPICFSSEKPELLKHYDGNIEIPNELFTIYQKLIEAFERGDAGDITQLSLPQCHKFNYEANQRPSWGYFDELNIPYVKSNIFDKYIRSVRKDAEGCYLIRTATTALWFIETKYLGWRLYRFLDKDIM